MLNEVFKKYGITENIMNLLLDLSNIGYLEISEALFALEDDSEVFNSLINHELLKEKEGFIRCGRKFPHFLKELIECGTKSLSPSEMLTVIKESERYVVLDIETSGFNAHIGDKIIEVGAILVEGGIVINEFQSYVNPKKIITNNHIHKISNRQLKAAPCFDIVWTQFKNFIKDYPVVMHNAHFDWYNFLGLQMIKERKILLNPVVCTLRLAKKYVISESHTLEKMCKKYNIEVGNNYHSALYDSKLTFQFLKKLLNTTIENNVEQSNVNNILEIRIEHFINKAKSKRVKVFESNQDNQFNFTTTNPNAVKFIDLLINEETSRMIKEANTLNYLDFTIEKIRNLKTFGRDDVTALKEFEINMLISTELNEILTTVFEASKDFKQVARWIIRGLKPIHAIKISLFYNLSKEILIEDVILNMILNEKLKEFAIDEEKINAAWNSPFNYA